LIRCCARTRVSADDQNLDRQRRLKAAGHNGVCEDRIIGMARTRSGLVRALTIRGAGDVPVVRSLAIHPGQMLVYRGNAAGPQRQAGALAEPRAATAATLFGQMPSDLIDRCAMRLA
jgi:hypothetical protein